MKNFFLGLAAGIAITLGLTLIPIIQMDRKLRKIEQNITTRIETAEQFKTHPIKSTKVWWANRKNSND